MCSGNMLICNLHVISLIITNDRIRRMGIIEWEGFAKKVDREIWIVFVFVFVFVFVLSLSLSDLISV